MLVAIAVIGGILLSSAHHLASMFIGIELLTLPLFGLIGYAFQQRPSLEASIKYMLLSAAASSFLVIWYGTTFMLKQEISPLRRWGKV